MTLMKIKVTPTPLTGLVLIDIDYFHDERGFFIEPWNKRDFAAGGLDLEFMQEGHSRSHGKVLRGLHYQDMRAPMGKLLRCTVGRIFDVAVDLRVSSPTFGRWFGAELDAESQRQIYVPPGFAHGFETLSDVVEVQYKQTGFYTPAAEGAIHWKDPDVGITWPYDDPLLSKKDEHAPSLQQYLQKPAFQ
jgi:dTDP-4-dehydrorhamnose 3,5-epimerase